MLIDSINIQSFFFKNRNVCTNVTTNLAKRGAKGVRPQLLPKCLKTSAEVLCKAGLAEGAKLPKAGNLCGVSFLTLFKETKK